MTTTHLLGVLVDSLTEFDCLCREIHAVYSREYVSPDLMEEITNVLEGSSPEDIFGILIENHQSILLDNEERLEAFTGDCSVITTWGVIGLDRQPDEWLSSDNFFWDLSEESPRLSIWKHTENGQTTIFFGNASGNTRVYGGAFALRNCNVELYQTEFSNAVNSLNGLYDGAETLVASGDVDRVGKTPAGQTEESLWQRVQDLIAKNEPLYSENEYQIQLNMSRKWTAAFIAACNAEGDEFDENFPPPISIVADLGASAIDNQDEFISDLESALKKLSSGEQMQGGEFIGQQSVSSVESPSGVFQMKLLKNEFHRVTSTFSYSIPDEDVIATFGSLERFKEIISHLSKTDWNDESFGDPPDDDETEKFDEFLNSYDFENREDDWVTDRKGGYDITYEIQDEEN